MKPILAASLVAAALFFAGCTATQITFNPQDLSPPARNPASAGNYTNATQNASAITLTLGEVAKHSTASDCWMAINGKVYDLSNFISHPSGGTYLPYCGTDATVAFDTKGGRGQGHSQTAIAWMASFELGPIGGSVSGIGANQTARENAAQNPPANAREDGREREGRGFYGNE